MKKILVILFVLLLLIGCGKEKSNSLYGSWGHDKYIYTFNEDGSCSYDSKGVVLNCKYTVDNDILVLYYDGNMDPYELTYRIEDGVLHIIDEYGSDVAYKRK